MICIWRKNIQAAYDLLTTEANKYPQHTQQFYEWRFDIAAKLGEYDLSEKILAAALDEGCFYGEYSLRKDDDMQVMQGRPEYEDLVTRSFQLLEKAQEGSKPKLTILNPGKPQNDKFPLFMAMHGNSSNVARFTGHWKTLVNSQWMVALPQSSQVIGKGIFSWNDMDTVERELCDHYQSLSAQYPVDPNKTIVSGFSKGGHAAINAALNGLFPVNGLIAIAPYTGNIEPIKHLIGNQKNRTLRAYFLLGEKDEDCTPDALKMHQIMSEAGIPCGMELFPGLGHDFPQDFDRVLQRVIDFVLGK